MSAGDMNEDSGSEDEVLKRLLELKELYKVQRDELGGHEGNSSEDGVGRVKSNPRKPRTKPAHGQAEHRLTALQSVILQTVEEHGGLCHAETIIEYVRLKWPELRKHDSSLYHTSDCRKVVDANLRGLGLFNQHEQEGYWCINNKWEDEDAEDEPRTSKSDDDDEAEGLLLLDSDFGKQVPMTHLITQVIEERGGGCSLENIYDYVLRNWERPYLQRSLVRRGLSDNDIKESIQVVLRTDPKYSRDPYNPDVFFVTHDYKPLRTKKTKPSSKGKSSPISVVPRSLSPIPPGASRVPNEPNRPRSNSTKRPRSQSTPNSRTPTTPTSPPPIPPTPPRDYQCLCGAREPGGKGKWHTAQGQWLCSVCGPQWSKKNSCPMCGKVYRNADAKYAIQNSWICCDDCHRWVMTKCDGIEDLSIYDDNNPDHIHYSCPLCRSIRRRQEEEKNSPESEKESDMKTESEIKQEPTHDKSPTPALPILPSPQNVKPVSAIIPIQAIHVIHAIGHQNSPSPTPFSTSSPRAHYLAESPTQHLLAPIARFHIGSFGRSPTSDREEEIDALMKIGSSTPPVTKIPPPVKIGQASKIGPITKIEIKKSKPPAKRSRAHEDALVPSQELTAEILSNMPLFSPSPRPQTPPAALSSPRTLASITRPIQIQSQPIQVQAQPIHAQPIQPQFQLSPVQFQASPLQFQASPMQLGSKLGSVQPQFGPIQPTGLFAHLTQTTQLLPQPVHAQAQTQAQTQYQFHQAHFKQSPPPVATPIKFDYVRDTPATNAANDVITQAPATPRSAGDANNFDREMTDTQMGEADSASRSEIDEMETGGNLDEDLRIFKESLEQERKTIWANYNI